MNGRFNHRTALVTGSSDGIGAAIAQRLAAEDAHVVVTGRDADRGLAVVDLIAREGGHADFIAVDLLGGADAVRRLADQAISLLGRVDILVNNAALLIAPAPTDQVNEDLIDQALSVNIKSAFLLTGILAPLMARRGDGAIVNIGSINGLFGSAGSALYSATKATTHSLTKSWADEYGPAGVRVNAVAPGPTLTTKIEAMQEYLAPMIAAMPSRRASTPSEVAAAVAFLVSDEASNIHGAVLSVDGGRGAV